MVEIQLDTNVLHICLFWVNCCVFAWIGRWFSTAMQCAVLVWRVWILTAPALTPSYSWRCETTRMSSKAGRQCLLDRVPQKPDVTGSILCRGPMAVPVFLSSLIQTSVYVCWHFYLPSHPNTRDTVLILAIMDCLERHMCIIIMSRVSVCLEFPS